MTIVPDLLSRTKRNTPPPIIGAVAEMPLESLVREGRVSVSPVLARRVLVSANYERQRPVSPSHVAFLADEMRRGSFLPGTQIAFARHAGKLVLVNGQHRLNAQIEADEDVEYQVVIHDAASDADVHRLYYRHDRGGRQRSDAQVLASVGVAEGHGITKTLARAVFQAMPLIANGFLRPNFAEEPSLRNDDLRLEMCKPWWGIAHTYEQLIAPAPRLVQKKLTSSQAVAVALVTLKHQPARASDFWCGIAKDDGLRRNDPRKALLIDLANREWSRRSSDGAVVTSLAWNAFYTGRPLSQIKIVNGASVRILGTPYDGRKR